MNEGINVPRMREPWRLMRSGARLAGLVVFASIMALLAHGQSEFSIDLKKSFAPEYPCSFFTNGIHFFGEDELLIGSSSVKKNCYRGRDQASLNLLTLDGRVLARKKYLSTYTGMVAQAGRVVFVTTEGLEVDDQSLHPIQTLQLPEPRRFMMLELHQQDNLTVRQGLNRAFLYGGMPLKLLGEENLLIEKYRHTYFEFSNGESIVLKKNALSLHRQGEADREIANLDWVLPSCKANGCIDFLTHETGRFMHVSTGKKRRVLIFSHGSRFLVTEDGGLFPFFRLEVFDVESGKSIYRKEYITLTGWRSAAISPDGDRLAMTDGQSVIIKNLP